MQFIDYDYQLELKSQIVQDALRTIGNIDCEVPKTEPSLKNKNYRHKVQYPVSQKKVSKTPIIGYYKSNSHEAVNIKYCPIQPEACDTVINYIRQNAEIFEITGYDEKNRQGLLRHILIRISSYNGQILLTFVLNSQSIPENLIKFAKKIKEQFPEIAGICANFNAKNSNVILGEQTICILGFDFIEEKLLDNIFKIKSDTFFQVNPFTAESLFNYIKSYIKDNFNEPTILDAYAGIAAIGITVSDIAKSVTSVEVVKSSCDMALRGINDNKIANLAVINDDTTNFLKTFDGKFEIIITDPPKKGSTEEALDGFLKCCKKEIIYVSCNPATLARDLKYLISKGCKLKSIKPFDMFCHSTHVETVAIIEMPN